MSHLLCLGYGSSAQALVRHSRHRWQTISGTSRSESGLKRARQDGVAGLLFDGQSIRHDLRDAFAAATHILVSAPPDHVGDPVLRVAKAELRSAAASRPIWIGYLSTVGVYGNTEGAWVDESSPTRPTHERSRQRIAAERDWLDFAASARARVQIFRLGGIYGPDRNPLLALRAGTAQRIVKPGQVFNRIHVDDIAQALAAGAAGAGRAGGIINVVDDEPAPPDEVMVFAADLIGIAAPPPVAFDDANLPAMAASFYVDNRRVRNRLLKDELGVVLKFPSYREGLTALAGTIGSVP
jgi:nucleoside-diphosphate-sugar epimerase